MTNNQLVEQEKLLLERIQAVLALSDLEAQSKELAPLRAELAEIDKKIKQRLWANIAGLPCEADAISTSFYSQGFDLECEAGELLREIENLQRLPNGSALERESKTRQISELKQQLAGVQLKIGALTNRNMNEVALDTRPTASNNGVDADSPTSMTGQCRDDGDIDNKLAGLFDPVSVAAIAKMFPDDKWSKLAERAKRNGLIEAREARGKFNPYRAAIWWLDWQQPSGWDMARVRRTLVNNLPSRSLDLKHLLTGEIE